MARVRDLGIALMPPFGPSDIGWGTACGFYSFCFGTMVCTDCTLRPFSVCGGTYWTSPWAGTVLTPEAIRQIRTQLQAQLEALKTYERVLNSGG